MEVTIVIGSKVENNRGMVGKVMAIHGDTLVLKVDNKWLGGWTNANKSEFHLVH